MKTNALVLLGTLLTIHVSSTARGAVIFSQDFSSSPNGPVSTYVNNSSPNNGQWNAIGTSGAGTTATVTDGELAYTRNALNAGSFSRASDFNPIPPAVIYRFALTVSGNTVAATSVAQWLIGSGFGTGNSVEAAGATHSKFGINFTATDGTFSFRDVSGGLNSSSFSGPQSVMWVVNNSGATLSYMGPDNNLYSVANDAWDLWAGSTLALNERSTTSSFQSLSDIKFVFNDGSGTIKMDNFQIETIEPVPEPTTISFAIFAAGGLSLASVRAWCNRRSPHKSKSLKTTTSVWNC